MTIEEDWARYQEEVEDRKNAPKPTGPWIIILFMALVMVVIYINQWSPIYYIPVIGGGLYLILKGNFGKTFDYINMNEAKSLVIKQLNDLEDIRKKYDVIIPKGRLNWMGWDMVENPWRDYGIRRWDYWELGFDIIDEETNEHHFSAKVDAIKPSLGCTGIYPLFDKFRGRTQIIKIRIVKIPATDFVSEVERAGGFST